MYPMYEPQLNIITHIIASCDLNEAVAFDNILQTHTGISPPRHHMPIPLPSTTPSPPRGKRHERPPKTHPPPGPPPSRRRLHPDMLIRQPKHHLAIRTRHHIKPWIPLHAANLPAKRQPRHRLHHLIRTLRPRLRIPHQRVLVRAARPNHVPPVGAEAQVALAGDGAAAVI